MLNVQKHKTILLQILKDTYADISIAAALGFKGGTAGFLFYNLPRFSVDLDFDLLNAEKADLVFEKIGHILQDYGKIKERYIKKNTLFYLLSYEEGTRNVKIEISLRNFGSAYEIKNYLGVSMLVMKQEDMFANKLLALLGRRQIANRDLYDIWFFLQNRWNVNEKVIEARTDMTLKNYLKKIIKFIENINTKYILAGLGELLDEKQKSFVKEKLKEEVLFLLKLKVREI